MPQGVDSALLLNCCTCSQANTRAPCICKLLVMCTMRWVLSACSICALSKLCIVRALHQVFCPYVKPVNHCLHGLVDQPASTCMH